MTTLYYKDGVKSCEINIIGDSIRIELERDSVYSGYNLINYDLTPEQAIEIRDMLIDVTKGRNNEDIT